MNISDKKVVHLTYQLEVDGKIADSATAERPLEFIFGMGYLLPKFEANIKDLKVGDKFAFTLDAEDGYGKKNPEMIIDLPINIFEVDGKVQEDILFVGNVLPMMNNMGGVMPGTILEVTKETVKMDLNHPMADKTLNFTGEVILVREATEEEITNGLHGERASQGCSCGCDSCGSGDCNCEGGCDSEGCGC
jgi:FKBP-type peptidyl-prolyl cis-trans isomerase SlyD